jgi:glycosyltransferase involved in cell wall biosynthesis
MKIALFLSQLTVEAEKEIAMLKNNFEVEVFLSPFDDKKILDLRGRADLAYVWQDADLADKVAQYKYILQIPFVYRQLVFWDKTESQKPQAKRIYNEADRIILTSADFEKNWSDLRLDIYELKKVMAVADSAIGPLFKELVDKNTDYKLTLCFFGSFDQFCTRNRTLLKGFAKNKIKVIKVNDHSPKLMKFWKLWQMHGKIKNDYDIMFVAFQGQLIAPLAWLLGRANGKKIVLDALFSVYDSMVLDRREVAPGTWRARFFHFLDWSACRLADLIIVHTKFHQEFFMEEFNLKSREKKFMTLYVGADDELLYPKPELHPKPDEFVVHFHGSYLPAQGLEQVIVGAAKILKEENITFNLIGRGQALPETKRLVQEWGLTSVNFIDPVPYRELGDYMNRSDVCLGSFGTSAKIMRVVPLKVFESLACGRALITARTPAVLQLLTERENCLLTELGDASDLAKKILELKNDPALKEKIAQNGYRLFKEALNPQATVKKLVERISTL